MSSVEKRGLYQERLRVNWTQEMRKKNLKKTAELIKAYGGYSKVLDDMRDFERFLSYEIGCKITTAKEYIDTVRGAAIFKSKTLARQDENQKKFKDKSGELVK